MIVFKNIYNIFFFQKSLYLVLDKAFHARWWDYSEVPLNINGYSPRVQLFCTLALIPGGVPKCVFHILAFHLDHGLREAR